MMAHAQEYLNEQELRRRIITRVYERPGQRVPVSELLAIASEIMGETDAQWKLDAELKQLQFDMVIHPDMDGGVLGWDLDEPIGLDEAAKYLDSPREKVVGWRVKQAKTFPAPLPVSPGGGPAWRRRDLRDWAFAVGHPVMPPRGRWYLRMPD